MSRRDADRVTFREVLAIREFRALYFAQLLSVMGDQLTRIAVATLIFDRTHSPLATGFGYALSYLPWLVGGPTLSVFADRYRHRTVMLICDLSRAVLVGTSAALRLPTGVLLCLIATVGVIQPPFSSARAALVPEVVGDGAQYTTASTLGNASNQLAVVVGFAVGGAAVGLLGPHATLGVDALTFVVSAAAIARYVRTRPPMSCVRRSVFAEMRGGSAAVFGDHRLRWLATTSWVVVGTAIATEAIAVPYARAHGRGPIASGVLTAALPAGTFIGALILGRLLDAASAERLMGPLALATPSILLLTAFDPSVVAAGALWFVAGAASAMSVVANRVFVVTVPASVRGRAFGVAASGISASQGLGTLAVGALARHLTPAHAVAVTAAIGAGLIALIGTPADEARQPGSVADRGRNGFGATRPTRAAPNE